MIASQAFGVSLVDHSTFSGARHMSPEGFARDESIYLVQDLETPDLHIISSASSTDSELSAFNPVDFVCVNK